MVHKGGDFGARHQIGRREFVRVMTAAGATTVLPAGSPRHAVAQSRGTTMVIAAPATPQSLDHEYDVSLGTIDAVGALYDNLLEYEKIPDPLVPAARREDTSVHTDKPYNLALRGKLAEKWEISSDGRMARFHLRPGVKSNWGNELTAEDVKWTWDGKLGLLHVDHGSVERTRPSKAAFAIPGPLDVVCRALVAPVALDPRPQVEPRHATVGRDFPLLGKLAPQRQVVRLVGVDTGVFTPGRRHQRIGNLLVFQKVVV